MEVVFIDPEPPDAAGGGIRTYIRLAMRTCREAGHSARVYTHNPRAYPGEAGEGGQAGGTGATVIPIGRRPWLRRPFRGLAYRLGYAANVLWEHANWLDAELAAGDGPGRVYEFADFQGYAFFALRNRRLRDRCLVRVHTPNFLVADRPSAMLERLAWRLAAWRERACLKRAPHLTAPSAEFVREKLPWLRGWAHVPNPLPPYALTETAKPRIEPHRFLYLGRVEERKGVMVLVRAFIRLAAEKPYATLTLVGGAAAGPYSAAVRYLIESLPPPMRHRVIWESPCTPEQRPALFKRFTALAAPSLWENSPYVYFEAMCAGLPCLGSATGEMKAVAAATGALTARPGDEADWLRILRAHCDGADAAVPEAQAAYLAGQRAPISRRLLAAWTAAAGLHAADSRGAEAA
jgi:glycosyltransferase involved in cell wall biosynthesis